MSRPLRVFYLLPHALLLALLTACGGASDASLGGTVVQDTQTAIVVLCS